MCRKGRRVKWPVRVSAEPYYYRKAPGKGHRRAFLYGGSDPEADKAQRMSWGDYQQATAGKKLPLTQEESKSDAAVLRAHEDSLRAILEAREEFSYLYAVDRSRDKSKETGVAVGKISNLLQDARESGVLGSAFQGIATPYSYYSAPGVHFSLHEEDSSALSLNWHLRGSKKYWLFIHGDDRNLFREKVVKLIGSPCEDVFSHKNHYFPTAFLDSLGVRWFLVPQRAGQVILTLPHCLHQGFSDGYSINVAINMVSRWWLPFGATSQHVSSLQRLPVLSIADRIRFPAATVHLRPSRGRGLSAADSLLPASAAPVADQENQDPS